MTSGGASSAEDSTNADFVIPPLVIGTIIKMWKVDAGYADLVGTVTLLSSATEGWPCGYGRIVKATGAQSEALRVARMRKPRKETGAETSNEVFVLNQ